MLDTIEYAQESFIVLRNQTLVKYTVQVDLSIEV